MKSMLIFPPGWDPRGPYLSLPVLKAYLQQNNQEVLIRDENVEFYDFFFSEQFFKRMSRETSTLKKEYLFQFNITYPRSKRCNTLKRFKVLAKKVCLECFIQFELSCRKSL